MRIATLVAALGLAAMASAQMPTPPFGSTYTATATRGFWFQAPANCLITGLSVPNESAQPFQAIEVVDLGVSPPPAYPSTIVGTQLFYDNASAGGSILSTAIPLTSGNYYGILGACTSSVGSATSYNSYSTTTGTFTSDILGIPTTITRFGTQFGIGAGGGQACWSELAGTISRVDVYVTSTGGGTIATNTTLGEGCVRSFTSFYENFTSPAAMDLANSSITLINTGGSYLALTGGTYNPVGSLGTPTTLTLTDDSSTPAGTLGLTVGSNGWIALGAGNSTSSAPTVAALLNNPATGFSCWHDYNPAAAGSGQVKYEESGTMAQITWDGVWDYAGTSAANANNLQFQIDTATGNVVMAWGTVSGLGGVYVVGYSPAGASLDPGSSNLSDVASGATTIVTGTTDTLPLRLTTSSRPVLGTNWNLNVVDIPATTVFGVNIWGTADPAVPDLIFLGMPGCQLRSTLDVIAGPWTPTAGAYAYTFPLPATPLSLVGFEVFAQAATFDAVPVNAFGAITSNGIKGTLGDL